MTANPIQFAVVREDPEIETQLFEPLKNEGRILIIGSGGCTLLTMMAQFPAAKFTVVEPNPSQIELIKNKLRVLRATTGNERNRAFSIGDEVSGSLTTCGNFESLFKSLRLFLYEFVWPREDWLRLFLEGKNAALREEVFAGKYWPVAFQLFFSDPMLRAVFGPMAIQHAAPGSYPGYFQRAFERGLLADDVQHNYFLHHVFLGHYLPGEPSLPKYLTASPHEASVNFEFKNHRIQDVESFGDFDLLSFSNIFDWMEEADVRATAERVGAEMKPGARLVYRQLNNDKDLRPLFGPDVQFENDLSKRLLAGDRSLFYSNIQVARKD